MVSSALSLQGVTKRIRNHTILSDVDLELKAGRIYGFVGNNGAGKTTLMRIITGLCKPSDGTVSLFSSTSTKELQLARKKVGALVSAPVYYDAMTPYQNLRAQGYARGRFDRNEVQSLLQLVGLDGTAHTTLRLCSTGMKQRYGLAFALLGNPELLILDEPINGLDPQGTRDIRKLILDRNQQYGTTMLISSHILSELYQVATDFIFIDHGKIIKQISHDALTGALRDGMDLEQYFFDLLKEGEECGS